MNVSFLTCSFIHSFLARLQFVFVQAFLDVRAMTYHDPWSLLAHVDVDSVLENSPRTLAEVAIILGMPEEVLQSNDITVYSALDEILMEKLKGRFRLFPPHQGNTALLNKLNGYPDIGARIQLKKKFLFMLENSPLVNWHDSSSVGLLHQHLLEGLVHNNRCPDGVSSFCDDFIRSFHMELHRTKLNSLPEETAQIIIAVSTFVYHMKLLFRKLHLSQREEHYEGRTAGELVLNYMLMLPLSLQGEYGSVKYPSFAVQGYSNKDAMDSDEVCKRFLYGGEISFTYNTTVAFPALTLDAIIDAFKQCIVKSETGSNITSPPTLPGMLPLAQMNYTISEDIIINFLRRDISIGPFYEAARASEFTCGNLYFRPTPDDEAEDVTLSTRSHIVKVLRDAAYVRIFQVCKYVDVLGSFQNMISSNWEASNMPLVR